MGPRMVAVGAFCIDSTEVTRGQYEAWLASSPSLAGQRAECGWNVSYAPNPNYEFDSTVCFATDSSCDQHPQVYIDFCDADAFCRAAGKRLCGAVTSGPVAFQNGSLGQWRTACKDAYPYGSSYVEQICNAHRSVAGAIAVASSPQCVALHGSAAVYDLSGNVAEWEDACSGSEGAADLCHVRGGSFLDAGPHLACESFPLTLPQRDAANGTIGFRCCK